MSVAVLRAHVWTLPLCGPGIGSVEAGASHSRTVKDEMVAQPTLDRADPLPCLRQPDQQLIGDGHGFLDEDPGSCPDAVPT